MCTFIATENVMPGYICCVCRSYNGLHRSCTVNDDYRTLCKRYDDQHNINRGNCPLTIPENIVLCSHCHAGFEKDKLGKPILPLFNMAGKQFTDKFCPVCSRQFEPFIPRTTISESPIVLDP